MSQNEGTTWILAQASQPSTGFTLPPPTAGGTTAPTPTPIPATGGSSSINIALPDGASSGPGGKELLIGVAILLVVAVILFFVRKAYVASLVEKRRSPRQASMAGWWLYFLLLSVTAVVIFAIIGSQWFFAPLYIGPVVLLAVVSLIGLVMSSMKKS